MSPKRDRDPWFDLPLEERMAQYARRKSAVDELVVAVRMHRADDCVGAPLCPGSAVSDRLSMIKPWEIGEFIATLLAHIVDDQEEIENMRVDRDRLRDRLRSAEARAEEAERDKEAGWAAYRSVHPEDPE